MNPTAAVRPDAPAEIPAADAVRAIPNRKKESCFYDSFFICDGGMKKYSNDIEGSLFD